MRERYARLISRSTRVTFAVSTVFAVGACTFLLDSERTQCRTNGDCQGRGIGQAVCSEGVCAGPSTPIVEAGDIDAPVDPMWGCVGKMAPYPAPDRNIPVQYRLRFLLGLSVEGLPGAHVSACEDTDPDCASPVAATTSDESGAVVIDVFNGFRGFFKIGSPDAGPPLYGQNLPAIPVPLTPETNPIPGYIGVWPVFRDYEFPAVAAASGGSAIKPGLAHMLFISLTCDQKRARGTTVNVDKRAPETYSFYTDDSNNPSLTLGATQSEGAGGYINLNPGLTTFTIRREEGGPPVSVHKVTLRKDELTLVTFNPNKAE